MNCPATPTQIRAVNQNNGTQAATAVDAEGLDVSEDGRYVIFAMADSTLTAGDANGFSDVFRFDRNTCILVRVSVADSGGEPNGHSYAEQISDDGNVVLLRSAATNLLTTATSSTQIFQRNMSTGVTTIVSVNSGGTLGNDVSFHASMSSDTRYIAFTSQADNLVIGDTNGVCDNDGIGNYTGQCADVFVRDTLAGTTIRVSLTSGGGEADGPVSVLARPVINDSGSNVAFVSYATNLTAQGVNNCTATPYESGVTLCPEIYWNNGTTTKRVNIATNNVDGQNERLYDLVIDLSADGRYVVFSSYATNLVGSDNNGVADVFMRDTQADTTTLVSLRNNGTPMDTHSGSASISEAGDRVGFVTISNTIMDDVGNSKAHFYVRSLSLPQTTRVSQSASSVMGNDNTSYGRIADGGAT